MAGDRNQVGVLRSTGGKPHVSKVSLGKDQTNIADQDVQENLPLLIPSLLTVQADGALHHGVLSHQNHALSHVTQTLKG